MAKTPDPHALRVARAVQKEMPETIVILFGSRAAGNHRDDSDLDLMVVTDGEDTRVTRFDAQRVASEFLKVHPPRLEVQIICMPRREFNRCRRANQHVAGQAILHGVIMSDQKLHHQADHQDHYPDHWPGTRLRIRNAERRLGSFNRMVQLDDWEDQEAMYNMAQQAAENALKGWLSAFNDERNTGHDLTRLWEDIKGLEDWEKPGIEELYDRVEDLFDLIRYDNPSHSGQRGDWLTNYARDYRYTEIPDGIDPAGRFTLTEKLNAAVEAIINRIHVISGTTSSDV